MKPELIIWDWNGTILDDVQVCMDIANRMLIERGLSPLPNLLAYQQVFGFPIKGYYEKMGYRFGPEDESYASVSDEFVELYETLYPTCSLRRGVLEELRHLKAQGLRQVLLSATRLDQLLEQLSRFSPVGDCFEQHLGLTDHYAFSKAALAKSFVEQAGVAPERTLFIGDTNHDYEVSSAIGCPCVLLTGGHQTRQRLIATGAPVMDSFEELNRRLGVL